MTKPKNKTKEDLERFEQKKKKVLEKERKKENLLNSVAFQLRLNKELSEKLKVIAERESRSLNGQIEYVLKKFIESEEAKK